eukprot:50240-Pelagomonas_calceolata.AAC.1
MEVGKGWGMGDDVVRAAQVEVVKVAEAEVLVVGEGVMETMGWGAADLLHFTKGHVSSIDMDTILERQKTQVESVGTETL